MSKKRVIASEDFGMAPTYTDHSASNQYRRTLETSVSYHIGNDNPFTYKPQPRGFYLSVDMREQRDEGRFTSERFGLFDGSLATAFIEPAARFSAKRLASIVPDAAVMAALRQRVLDNVARGDARDRALYGKAVTA